MTKFTDRTGREWTLDITVAAVKRVRKLLDVDLLAVLDDGASLLQRLGTDLALLVDVLFALIKPDAETLGVSDEDFGRSFSGDSLLAARDALFKELTLFFPNPSVRNVLSALLDKGAQVETLVMEDRAKRLAEINPQKEADKILSTASREASERKSKSGSVPESSG